MPTISNALREMYSKFDAEMDRRVKEMNATCKVGCNNCCMLFATCTLPEGILIAETLLQKPDWRAMVPKLREAALKFCFDGVRTDTYLDKKIQCVFLSEGLCSIYEMRPSVCRFYYSVVDPANCDPDDHHRKVATIDASDIRDRLNIFAGIVANKLHTSDLVAPIPVMVLYCMYMLVKHKLARKDDAEALRTLDKAMEGVPTPSRYIERYPSVLEDPEEEPVRLTPEQFKELQKR